jgi:hypothetical protein
VRAFIDGSGADSTTAVRAYLASHRQLNIADLYVINTAPNYTGHYLGKQFLLTDYGSPLKWTYKGTFSPAVISRGEVESKIGLEADTLDITWSPLDTDVLASGGSPSATILTALQGFGCGIFDNATVEVWRCLMPAPGESVGSPAITAKLGNCDVFGACLMFAGRVGDTEPDRQSVKISVVSRIETLNIQVPTNLIEPTNILAQYLTGQIPAGGPSSMSVVGGSTVIKVYADDTGSPVVTMPAGTYDSGYIVFGGSSHLAGTYRGVRVQTVETGHHAFYLYEPLPFTPTAGDTITAYVPIARDYAGAIASGVGYAGFPYVPNAINSSVVIA